jgi:hypothetical protein
MRKIIAVLAFFLILTAVGCGSKPKIAPFTLEKDMGIKVKGTWYPIHTDSAGLLYALGSQYTLNRAPSCVFIGEDKDFTYTGCVVYTNPDGPKDIWYEIILKDTTLSTVRGIRIGSTRAEVEAAYGPASYYEDTNKTIATYSVSGKQGDIASPNIQFTYTEEKVKMIDIYYPTNVK